MPEEGSGTTNGPGDTVGEDDSHGDQEAEKTHLDAYLRGVVRRIEKAKRYPRQARRRGWEGTVEVEILILASGEVHQTRLQKKSQYRILDNAALKAIEKVKRFPAFPPELSVDSLTVTIPLTFTLVEAERR